MSQSPAAVNGGEEAVPARQAHDDPDDGAYPSSESDAEIDGAVPSTEARPLLSSNRDKAEQAESMAVSDTVTTSNQAQTRQRRRTPLKWTEVIWVTCTLSLIATLGYSSQLSIMLPYYTKPHHSAHKALPQS